MKFNALPRGVSYWCPTRVPKLGGGHPYHGMPKGSVTGHVREGAVEELGSGEWLTVELRVSGAWSGAAVHQNGSFSLKSHLLWRTPVIPEEPRPTIIRAPFSGWRGIRYATQSQN